ncbi:RNY1-A Ribonuclease T2-like 1-A [Candida maltosa Xu316]|uniref:Ribonuclease T2-like n=1 Tax=Candida maltosa (strain Xu316) TaxID=1245528 RepID=M3HGZ3_CANMX|nr:hypothetical protein G210_3214 [Candida maltosa Xu316]
MKFLLLIAALFISKVYGADLSSSCPIDSPISCSNTGDTSNSCCYESPAGVVQLTQFWDYNPSTGPNNLFTLHGLWPDACSASGGYPESCDPSLEIASDGSTVQDIVVNQFNDQTLYNNLNRVWTDINGKNAQFWAHEWNKHGTCYSTIKPSCYPNFQSNENVYNFFAVAYQLFQNLDTYSWLVDAGITPSSTTTYTLAQIQSALDSKFGKSVYFKCDSNHAINEVWYYHHVKGSILSGDFLPIDAFDQTNCPQTGIKFPPKGSSAGTTTKTTATGTKTTTTSAPTGTEVPASSYIYLTGKSGCLISNGKWYTSGTCATYKFAQGSSGTTITSSKGTCGLDADDNFTCSSSVVASSNQFQISNGKVGINGNFDWCLGDVSGSGSTAQTNVKLADGSCSSFQLSLTQ